jgi:hypothetical protein
MTPIRVLPGRLVSKKRISSSATNQASALPRCMAGRERRAVETPVVERPGERQSMSAASAVNSKEAFWFATY